MHAVLERISGISQFVLAQKSKAASKDRKHHDHYEQNEDAAQAAVSA